MSSSASPSLSPQHMVVFSSSLQSLVAWERISTEIRRFASSSLHTYSFNPYLSHSALPEHVDDDDAPRWSYTYALVYSWLATVHSTPSQPHSPSGTAEESSFTRAQMLLALLWSSLMGWARETCEASGGRLSMPLLELTDFEKQLWSRTGKDGVSAGRSQPYSSQMSPSSDPFLCVMPPAQQHRPFFSSPFYSVTPESSGGGGDGVKAAIAVAVQRDTTAWRGSLCRSFFMPPEEAVAGINGSGDEDDEGCFARDLHVLVTLAKHYTRMQRFLSHAFLRLTAHTRALPMDLVVVMTRYIMSAILTHNMTWVRNVLLEAVRHTLGTAALDGSGGGSGVVMWSNPSTPPHRGFATRAEAPVQRFSEHQATPMKVLRGDGADYNNNNSDCPCRVMDSCCARYGQPQHPSAAAVKEASLFSLSHALTLVADCHLIDLQRCFLAEINHLCVAQGGQIAASVLLPLCAHVGRGEGAPPFISSQPTSGVSAADAAVVARVGEDISIIEVTRALRDITRAFAQLRAALLFTVAGTRHYLEAVTPAGATYVTAGLQAFLSGLCADGVYARVVKRWGVALWLQLCDDTMTEAHQQQQQQRRKLIKKGSHDVGDGKVRSPRASLGSGPVPLGSQYLQSASNHTDSSSTPHSYADAVSHSTGSVVRRQQRRLRQKGFTDGEMPLATSNSSRSGSWRGSNDENDDGRREGGGYELPRQRRQIRDTDVRMKAMRSLCEAALLPDDGLPSLFYFLPRERQQRQHILELFGCCVSEYLVSLLVDSTRQQEEQRKITGKVEGPATTAAAATAPLPGSVFERCVYVHRMSQAAFNTKKVGTLSGVLTAAEELESNDAERHAIDVRSASPFFARPSTASTGSYDGSATVTQPRDIVSSSKGGTAAEAALASVRAGLKLFFASYAARAALTLALALNTHVLASLQRGGVSGMEVKKLERATNKEESSSAMLNSADLEVVDTLLDLVSLLPSPEGFASHYKALLAVRLMQMRTLDELRVDKEVIARMEVGLGSEATSACRVLMKDVKEALLLLQQQPQQDIALASSPTYSLLVEPQQQQQQFIARTRGQQQQQLLSQTRTTASPLVDSPLTQCSLQLQRRLCLAHLLATKHGSRLLRHILVLRKTWWEPYTSGALLSSGAIKVLYEQGRWFTEGLVDAVLRTEWHYCGGSGSSAGEGGGAENNNDEVMENASFEGYGRYQGQQQYRQQRYHSRVDSIGTFQSSVTSFSHSTSTVVQGISFALTSAVQQQGSRIVGTLRLAGASSFGNDDVDERYEDDFREAYGGLLPPSMRGGGSSFQGASSVRSSLGTYSDDDGANSMDTVPPGVRVERRRLRWPMLNGEVTVVVHAARDKQGDDKEDGVCITGTAPHPGAAANRKAGRKSVQVVGPPAMLLLLQLVERCNAKHPSSRAPTEQESPVASSSLASPCTFEYICSSMPVQVPRAVVGSMLSTLLHAGVVERYVYADPKRDGSKKHVYFVSSSFERVQQRKVYVQAIPCAPANTTTGGTNVSQKSQDSCGGAMSKGTQELSASLGTPSVSGTEKRHSVEACIIHLLKKKGTMTHRGLQARVVEQLKRTLVVTPALFKHTLSTLVEKGFISRNVEEDSYVYVA